MYYGLCPTPLSTLRDDVCTPFREYVFMFGRNKNITIKQRDARYVINPGKSRITWYVCTPA